MVSKCLIFQPVRFRLPGTVEGLEGWFVYETVVHLKAIGLDVPQSLFAGDRVGPMSAFGTKPPFSARHSIVRPLLSQVSWLSPQKYLCQISICAVIPLIARKLNCHVTAIVEQLMTRGRSDHAEASLSAVQSPSRILQLR